MHHRLFSLFALLTGTLALTAPGHAAAVRHHARHHRHVRTTHAAAPAAKSVQVWVNLNSGIYHYPGERWYGNTANGQYMSEDAAKKAGYRATENGQ